MSYIAKKAEDDKYILKIVQDDIPENPRKEWDHLGHMVCWHKRHKLGDDHDWKDPQDFIEEILKRSDVIALPLYLIDHSGLSMSTGDFSHCDPGGWDSGQVGWIYVIYGTIRKEYGDINDETIAKAKKALQSEVEEYDMYLRGDVWGFTLTKKCECCGHEDEVVESCWGFYGLEYLEQELKSVLPEAAQHLVDKLNWT